MIDPHISEDRPVVTRRVLRQFALLSLVVFGGLAVWQGVFSHPSALAIALAGFAIAVGGIGLLRPEKIRVLYGSLMALTAPIGRIVSFALLAGIYFFIFTPLGILFRLLGRDALAVRPPGRASHWVEKPAATDMRSYLRQS